MEEMTKKDYEEMKEKKKEELQDLITKLKKRFEIVKELKELKDKHERENASPVFELMWKQEYELLPDYIKILEIHKFMM